MLDFGGGTWLKKVDEYAQALIPTLQRNKKVEKTSQSG